MKVKKQRKTTQSTDPLGGSEPVSGPTCRSSLKDKQLAPTDTYIFLMENIKYI